MAGSGGVRASTTGERGDEVGGTADGNTGAGEPGSRPDDVQTGGLVDDLTDDLTDGPADDLTDGFAEGRGRTVGARIAGVGIVVAAFGAAVASMVANGAVLTEAMVVRTWQIPDTVLLADDPIGTTWYQHVQPPLYGLFVGSVLRWSPFPPIGTLYVLYLAAVLALGLLLWDLLCRWRVHPVGAGLVAAVVITSPDLLRTIVWQSYEVPVALLLVLAVWCLQRHLQGAGSAWLVAGSGALTAAALTRSLLHPVLVVAAIAFAGWLGRAPRRVVAIAVAVPIVLVGGWMVRGQILFDTTSTSSWLGFNLQRGVTAPMERTAVEAAVADGAVTENALVQPWQDLEAYGVDDCEPDGRHPVLGERYRRDSGAVNLNNACFLDLYREAEANARTLVRREPGRYLSSRVTVLATSFSVARLGLPDDVASFTGHVRPERTWMDGFADLWQLPEAATVDMGGWNLPLLGQDELPHERSWTLVLASLALLARAGVAGVRIVRSRGDVERPDAEGLWVLGGALVGVVVLGSSLVEFGENGRFRATVDPLIVGFTLGAALRWAEATLRARRR